MNLSILGKRVCEAAEPPRVTMWFLTHLEPKRK